MPCWGKLKIAFNRLIPTNIEAFLMKEPCPAVTQN